MSADEFWKDDPQLFVSYRISFINKKKREMEEHDYKSWLLGLYIYDGNSKLTNSLKQFLHNIVASFGKSPKDNTDIGTYPKKPYIELEKEQKKAKKEEEQKSMYKEFEESLVYYGTMKQRYVESISNSHKKGV